jgi:hypothetical protein
MPLSHHALPRPAAATFVATNPAPKPAALSIGAECSSCKRERGWRVETPQNAHDLRALRGLTAAVPNGTLRDIATNARSRPHRGVDPLTWSPVQSTVSAVGAAQEART